MKTKIIFFALLVIITTAFISMKTLSKEAEGPHGGKVRPAGKFNIETKMLFPQLYTYLLNEKNIPISNKDVTCDILFYMPDNIQTSLPLKAEGEDGFLIETQVANYTSYRVTFTAFGKSISATFENQNVLVKGN